MSDDSGSDDEREDTAAQLNNIVQPLRKQLKKNASKIEKLTGLVTKLEEERVREKEKREEMEKQMSEMKAGSMALKAIMDSTPWRVDSDRVDAALRGELSRVSDQVDENRVQTKAHTEVFTSMQTGVAEIKQNMASLQAEQSSAKQANAEELRHMTARMDHMRGEFSERVSHTFTESTSHADRLGQRLQDDLHRIDQEVSQRAQSRVFTEGMASLQSELSEARTANDELRIQLRSATTQLEELRESQLGCVTKSQHATTSSAAEQKMVELEQKVTRMDVTLQEASGELSGGRFGQRQGLIETRQMNLERAVKQVESQMAAVGDELGRRPLKTDMISAIAQQELAVEACAPRDAVERLEAALQNCAQAASLAALEENVRLAQEQLTKTAQNLLEVQEGTPRKSEHHRVEKEIDMLRTRVEEKVGRDECTGMLASKFDKAAAQAITQQQEELQGMVVGAEAAARRVQDALSNTTNQALDSQSGVMQVNGRIDRLSALTQEMDGRLGARKHELQSLTKVVRLILDDAEMRCAIDEAEGATAAEATDVLARLRGLGGKGNGQAMSVTGVTLHRPPGGPLQPMPPGSAAADKVWYKQNLQPRSEVLGARRRMLVNARHSWVGDSCLAQVPTEASGSEDPYGNVGSGGAESPAAHRLPPLSPAGDTKATTGLDVQLTPSSTGASPSRIVDGSPSRMS